MLTRSLSLGATIALVAAASSVRADTVRLEDCLADTLDNVGGDALHVEFESRGGMPVYEFIVKSGDQELYVGCDATSGRIAEIDVIVGAEDPRWTALAKIDEAAASKAATERYKGEVEEVKRLLLSTGAAVYEVDVEIDEGNGEYNVYVDAATGKVSNVNFEYWEIGRPAAE